MKILICPLNWGLGHATRCVPLIRKYISDGHEPVIVADEFPLEFLKTEFPALRFIHLPSYSIYYSASKSQIGAMLLSSPAIIAGIIKEQFWLKKFLKQEHFDLIISDNRFGMWSNKVKSVYITHQLMVKMPRLFTFLEPLVWFIHQCFIRRYSECWIPDVPQSPGLTGDLSHRFPAPFNAKFIGLQSRFENINVVPNRHYKVVCIVSGVEPQRTIFEKLLIDKYKTAAFRTLILKGQPQLTNTEVKVGNVHVVSHLSDGNFAAVLLGAEKIVSRSGYSTIMDLAVLKCLFKAEFTPTPGQTEQEYLASIHASTAN